MLAIDVGYWNHLGLVFLRRRIVQLQILDIQAFDDPQKEIEFVTANDAALFRVTSRCRIGDRSQPHADRTLGAKMMKRIPVEAFYWGQLGLIIKLWCRILAVFDIFQPVFDLRSPTLTPSERFDKFPKISF
jgi:hypothetical protein